MAVKSVFEINVEDSQFKEFYKLFQEYQEHLGKMPDDWRKVDLATRKAAQSFASVASSTALLGDIAAHTGDIAAHLKKATEAQKNFHRETRGSAKELKAMAGYAHSLGSSIFGIGKYLFKIGALGGGISLLGGFGLRELGEGAVRRQAQGRRLGLTPGQVSAWNTDFGQRYIGINAVQSVFGEQMDASKWGALLMATQGTGIAPNQAFTMAPDRLTYAIAQASAQRWNRESASQRALDPFLKAQASAMGGDLGTVRMLAVAEAHGELAKAWAHYQKNAAAFNVSDKNTGAWYDFTRKLSVAGNLIEADLTNKLAALAPSMGALIKSLGTDGEKLINDVLTPKNIAALQTGIDEFVGYLGSPAFKKNVAEVETGMKAFAHAMGWVADKLEGKKPADTSGKYGNAGFSDPRLNPYNTKVWFTPGFLGLLVRHQAYEGRNYWKINPDNPDRPGTLNNPGNIKDAQGHFKRYASMDAGYRDMARLLTVYQDKHHIDNIADIVKRWAPPSDHNNDAAYIKDVSAWTGFGPKQRLNLHDPATASKLISAMARQENGIRVSPNTVRIVIDNKAGANVAVSTYAAAQ